MTRRLSRVSLIMTMSLMSCEKKSSEISMYYIDNRDNNPVNMELISGNSLKDIVVEKNLKDKVSIYSYNGTDFFKNGRFILYLEGNHGGSYEISNNKVCKFRDNIRLCFQLLKYMNNLYIHYIDEDDKKIAKIVEIRPTIR